MPKINPLKLAQFTLPTLILEQLLLTFNITHSYFSYPITCPTILNRLFSPFPRNKVFGSLKDAFSCKWKGISYAHAQNDETTQEALHWARLATQDNPTNITILTLQIIYENYNPLLRPFPDTYVITYFPPDTIIYEEPNIPSEPNIPRN